MSKFRSATATAVAVAIGAIAAPAAAQAHEHHHSRAQDRSGVAYRDARSFGDTFLQLDPSTAQALGQLGITPSLIAPAFAGPNGSFAFPITDSFGEVKHSDLITHSGGIALTKGTTTVKLTDFVIDLKNATLSAIVNGGPRVTILNLDGSMASVMRYRGAVVDGPFTGTLTQDAATALDNTFNTTAISAGLALGKAVVVEKPGENRAAEGSYSGDYGHGYTHDGYGYGHQDGQGEDR